MPASDTYGTLVKSSEPCARTTPKRSRRPGLSNCGAVRPHHLGDRPRPGFRSVHGSPTSAGATRPAAWTRDGWSSSTGWGRCDRIRTSRPRKGSSLPAPGLQRMVSSCHPRAQSGTDTRPGSWPKTKGSPPGPQTPTCSGGGRPAAPSRPRGPGDRYAARLLRDHA